MFKKGLLLIVVLSLMAFNFAGCAADDASASATAKSTPTQAKTDPPKVTEAKTESPTPEPSPTESTKVTEYSIEMDFQIEEGYFSFVFGALDTGNYLLWQVNLVDFGGDEYPTFKPHACVDGQFEVLEQFDMSNAIKWEDRFDLNKVKVTINEENEITTYFNDVEIHKIKHEYAKYGMYGHRACTDESYYVDNIVIKNTKTDKVLEQFNFDDDDNPFYDGEIIPMDNGSPALYLTAASYSAPDLVLLD